MTDDPGHEWKVLGNLPLKIPECPFVESLVEQSVPFALVPF